MRTAPLRLHFLSLFPEILQTLCRFSLFQRAVERGVVSCSFYQLRDFALDVHRTVDDAPYGGGEGMVLRADVLFRAWNAIRLPILKEGRRCLTLLLSPQGRLWGQVEAQEAAEDWEDCLLICGHYEGVDERFIAKCVDREISIGNYILTGGELPALVVADSVVRLIPGVVGNWDSVVQDSLSQQGLLKYPQYTRPIDFEGEPVPPVLLSGHHEEIRLWRAHQKWVQTQKKRPDLLAPLSFG